MIIGRRLLASLALIALVSNGLALARPIAGSSPVSDGQAFTLVSLKHESAGAITRILIESNAPPLYTVFRPTDRLIIVDLPGGDGSSLAPEYSVKNSLVDSVIVRRSRVGSSARATTRVEIALRAGVRDRTALNGNTLVIELTPAQPDNLASGLILPKQQAGESKADENSNAALNAKDAKRNEASKKTGVSPAESHGVYVYPTPVSAKTPFVEPERAQPSAAQPGALKPATLVRSVRSEAASGAVRVFVDADGAAQFKDFVLPDPWRIVIDITGVRTAFGNKTIAVGASLVDRVRVGQPAANVVRIVVDTRSKLPYRVARDGASLVITVGNSDEGQVVVPASTAKTEASTDRAIKAAGQQFESKQNASAPSTDEPGIPANLIAQTGKPSAGAPSQSNQRITSQPNPRLPLPSPPASSSSGSAKETIIQPAENTTYNRSAMDVQRQSPQQRNTNTGLASSSAGSAQASRTRGELAFCDSGYVGGLISFDLRAGVDITDMLRFISQQYGVNFIVDKSVGKVPVDIRVTDIPWNQVMESVMRANRLGAVCESGGRIIRIATLAAIKEEEEQQRAIREEQAKQVPLETKIIHLKYARAVGSLGATGSGASGRGGGGGGGGSSAGGGASSGGAGGQTRGTLLSIANSRLSQRGRIEMDARTNSLIVTDLPEYVAAIEDIVSKLDRPEPQVEIEARIVIASRNFLRDVGTELAGAAVNSRRGSTGLFETTPIQLQPGSGLIPGGKDQSGGGGSSGGGSGSGSGGDQGGSSKQTGLGPNLVGPFATEALRSGAANTVLSLTTGLIGTSILSMALSASETKGQIRTIASPRITAQDNQTAEIVNGVQIPVQTVSNNTITTTFVTAALRLEITPQIIEETGEVLMHVVAENNTVNFALANQFNNGTPGINTQAAESIVRVQDGGTTVMGGINIDTEGQSQNRTPGLSRLPLVGELFKRRTTRRDFDEILFFITPRIVKGDGTTGPRSLAPHRSAAEPSATNPLSPQRAAAPSSAGAQRVGQVQGAKQPAKHKNVAANLKNGQ